MHPIYKLLLLLLLGAPLNAEAVLLAVGDGSRNTTAPADDPGFSNVGVRGSGTAIYLGNRWVLTAAHIGAGNVTLSGTSYGADLSTTTRLENAGGGLTDMVMFRLQADPGLPTLNLSTTSPGRGSQVVMIGAGRDRAADLTHWNVSGSTWTEVSASDSWNASGYEVEGTRSLRWGENAIVTFSTVTVNSGSGDVTSFGMNFSQFGLPDEAHGVRGDSGGAVFVKNEGTWELAGMMHANTSRNGQPGDTAVFGNYTYAADVATYFSDIDLISGGTFTGNAIPEPSSALLIGLGLLLALRRKRI